MSDFHLGVCIGFGWGIATAILVSITRDKRGTWAREWDTIYQAIRG